ncbi:MAG: coenzyme F420-0:L-glutamate ligase [Thermoproteota archaeon]|nr:MAG: coenzyme F420-0:L-glutamate ligase [Candidatus Korarchaeota archaeon]
MRVIPLKSRVIKCGDDLVGLLLDSIEAAGESLDDGDIVAVADKVIAHVKGRIVDYSSIKPSEEAVKLAREAELEPGFAELVLEHSDLVIGTAYRTILTIKDGVLVANAGIDHKNAPGGHAALWPEDPNREAEEIRLEILRRTSRRVGVIVVDSRLAPLRRGTTGFALGISGFKGVRDFRGGRDLFGNRIYVTMMNVADELASAAHLYMGEAAELTPFVLIKDPPVELGDFDPELLKISPEECAYFKPLYSKLASKLR